jgi:hypothetical protein
MAGRAGPPLEGEPLEEEPASPAGAEPAGGVELALEHAHARTATRAKGSGDERRTMFKTTSMCPASEPREVA